MTDPSYGQPGDDKLDVGDVRRVVALVLVVVGSALLLVGGITLYAREEIFDAGDFADRATASLEDKEVRAVLSDQIVDQVIDQGSSELIQARPLLESVVAYVLGTKPFQAIFRRAAVQVHKALFSRDEGSIVLDLADTGTIIISAAKAVSPDVAKRIPADVQPGLIEVSERSFATDTLEVAEEVRFLGVLLPLLSLGCFVAAFAIGHDRRRTAVNFGAGIAAAGALGVVSWMVARALLVAQFDEEDQRRAAEAVWDTFMVDARTWALVIGGAGIVIAAAASTYLQHEDLSDEAQALGRRLLATPQRRWVRLVRALGIAAVSLFVILQPTYAVQIAVIIVGGYGLYYAVGELLWLYQPRARPGKRRATAALRLRGYSRRVAVVTAAVVALGGVALGAALFALRGGDDDGGPRGGPVPISQCNGHRELCNRRLNEVALASTHNSMSAAESRGWYFAGHRGTIGDQLRAGVRGLLIDTHYGVRNEKGRVRTDLESEGQTKEKVVAEIGEEAFAAAERLVGRIGFGPVSGERNMYLCHTLCELGATPFSDALREIRDFLDEYPNEVVVVFIQDATTPADTARAFEEAGLERYVYTHDRDEPWPTLREMISSGKRLLVMAEERTAGAPEWYHQGFELVQETPYQFHSVEELGRGGSCRPGRGTPDSPLFQLNHWIERVNPSPGLAARVNAREVLLTRARLCRRIRGLVPNLVNVDFYDEGDVFGTVRALNGLPEEARPVYARR